MKSRIFEGWLAVVVTVAAIGFAATAPAGHEAAVEAQLPAINQGTTVDNSRECEPGSVDVSCVYL